MSAPATAVSLKEAASRCGISYSHARRLIADGTFPIPALPRLGRPHKFSTVEIDRYLHTASTADAQKASGF